MRQQRRLNLFQRSGNVAGIETDVVPVQYVTTLRRMSKDAAQDRIRDAVSCGDACKQLSQIVHAIQEGKYVIEGDLRREIGMNLPKSGSLQ